MEETEFLIEHQGDTDLYKLYLYSYGREVSCYALDEKHLLKLKKAIDKVLELEHNNNDKTIGGFVEKKLNELQEELDEIKERISKLERDKQILVPFVQTTDFPCDGIHCDNPHMDCINCPRKAGYGWNTGQVTITTTEIKKS